MIKTSDNSPLQINSFPLLRGEIGMTICPGKHDKQNMSDAGRRDLKADIQAIKDWGASLVVTLMEDWELTLFEVSDLGEAVENAGMEWLHYPIIDGMSPDSSLSKFTIYMRIVLAYGGKILIHCRGGLGRTGTMASRLLIEEGVDPVQAMRIVRYTRTQCVESTVQEQYLLDLPALLAKNLRRDKVRAMLIGGACGDALGAAVECDTLEQIQEKYGIKGIRDFAPMYGKIGAITDDTQLTLFTAEAMINGISMSAMQEDIAVLHKSYMLWYETQTGKMKDCKHHTMLTYFEELWNQRSPGNTCLTSLQNAVLGQYPENDRKGCGTVMRVAPLGIAPQKIIKQFDNKLDEYLFLLGSFSSRLTHAHVDACLSAAYLVLLIHYIVQGDTLDNALDKASQMLANQAEHEHVLSYVNKARTLAKENKPDVIPEDLGSGWLAEEALAIALYCALICDNFEEAVLLAVNHSGDSDSTGSITGQICGVLYGMESIPSRWKDNVELKDIMRIFADMLVE